MSYLLEPGRRHRKRPAILSPWDWLLRWTEELTRWMPPVPRYLSWLATVTVKSSCSRRVWYPPRFHYCDQSVQKKLLRAFTAVIQELQNWSLLRPFNNNSKPWLNSRWRSTYFINVGSKFLFHKICCTLKMDKAGPVTIKGFESKHILPSTEVVLCWSYFVNIVM